MHTNLDLPITDDPIADDLVADGTDALATCDLITALEANPRFRRDSLLGGIFHLGRISFREVSSTDSVHIVIRGDRVSAHVDDVSPLVVRPDGTSRYAWGRVVAHNLAVIAADLSRRVRGVRGHQRCELRCEAVVVDDALQRRAGDAIERRAGDAIERRAGDAIERRAGDAIERR